MAEHEKRYSVVADWDEYFAELERCPESQQGRVTDLVANILTTNPKVTHPPLLKKLHGVHSHLWQFECGGSRRLLYSVDDRTMTVRIEYFGPHPPWDKPNMVGR